MKAAVIAVATAAAVAAAVSACSLDPVPTAAHPTPTTAEALPSASTPSPDCLLVDLTIVRPEQVTIHLTNGSDRAGLGQQVATELASRGFRVADVADGREFGGVTALTFGPEGVGAAWLVSAFFLAGDLESTFDAERGGADVDLVLGQRYERLSTPTEVNQRVAAIGPPSAPPGTCGR